MGLISLYPTSPRNDHMDLTHHSRDITYRGCNMDEYSKIPGASDMLTRALAAIACNDTAIV